MIATEHLGITFDVPRSAIVVPSDQELSDQNTLHRLAADLARLNKSRREIPNWLADTIYEFSGVVEDREGNPFEVGPDDIDDAFSDDGSFRWISDFLKYPARPWKQKPQGRVFPRLRLLAVSMQINEASRKKPDRLESIVLTEFTLALLDYQAMGLSKALAKYGAESRAGRVIQRQANRDLRRLMRLIDGPLAGKLWSKVRRAFARHVGAR